MKTTLLFLMATLICFTGLSQTTAVPDANFEAFLETNGMGDGIPNNQLVTTANISGVTSLSADGLGIIDLTGIEDFAALQTLLARNNGMTTVAFSANQNITSIRLSNNNLTSVPGLELQTNAQTISLSNNPINSALLDLTQNVNLVFLAVDSCTLTSLDVTQNAALTDLTAINNSLTFLDLSNNPVLTGLEVNANDPALCIQVTDPAAANAGTGIYTNWLKDASAIYSLNCSLGTIDFAASRVNLYPNPTTDFLTISLEDDANYTLANIHGQVLEQGRLNPGDNTLDVLQHASGLYFLDIETSNERVVLKIIKQ